MWQLMREDAISHKPHIANIRSSCSPLASPDGLANLLLSFRFDGSSGATYHTHLGASTPDTNTALTTRIKPHTHTRTYHSRQLQHTHARMDIHTLHTHTHTHTHACCDTPESRVPEPV
ncbi:unnamed protein product [Protopolystoma xenopodis]|uniref:Uncharacterized protein n=1 Tax=Protopolystoma xenopodis TaxID=117903 RepID=A0A448X3Y9_9PLAT|nr:unnamed protein product [Protopolystoma xenopodis]